MYQFIFSISILINLNYLCFLNVFLKKIKKNLFFYFFKINIFLVFLDYFDALMSKIIFKK